MPKFVIVFLSFIYILFGVAVTICFLNYSYSLGQQKAVEGKVIITAEITSVIIRPPDSDNIGSGDYYLLEYSCVVNDIEYKGHCDYFSTDYEDAKSHLGETVEIYIDESGASILVGKQPNPNIPLICGIIFSMIFIGYNVFLIVFAVRTVKWRKSLKSKTEL